MEKADNLGELLEAQTHVWNAMFHFKKSACVKCAVELGIPDVISNHGKPITLSDLISVLPIHPSKSAHIFRLMRFLANSGFFVEDPQGYTLTSAGRLLLKDEPFNVRAFIFLSCDPALLKPWNFLTEWFQNDDPSPFDTAYGNNLWHYNAQEVRIGNMFNEAMASDNQLSVEVLMTKCKSVFEGMTTLADVGGGTGKVARAIAQNFPGIKCTVYDLPHVVANQGGAENLEFLAGDMFQSVPRTNAILLKWILHNWNDEECVQILRKCKEAIPSKENGGKVIIIDMVLSDQQKEADDHEAIETQLFFDMMMMVLLRGKQRNEREWAKLFSEAGFNDYKITPVLGLRSLIEVYY
ncbi:trans-resveratrol di-O-methyltransferase-like [Coffea eugenioides]|uniref:trans-resveratrol di-O-methyltransferase-like n=1 Tax=Coffea eugenioides TaxID=49369 RepID=UPI000F61364F|nr:trans-resveratrol di-O-methyltransferase-like [Coffea eugenioides]